MNNFESGGLNCEHHVFYQRGFEFPFKLRFNRKTLVHISNYLGGNYFSSFDMDISLLNLLKCKI